ncbi:MAG: signal peptidase I, partial [Planctomycetes bacterium]|nr:signal peptidase I [Planctomycetota bacterium]
MTVTTRSTIIKSIACFAASSVAALFCASAFSAGFYPFYAAVSGLAAFAFVAYGFQRAKRAGATGQSSALEHRALLIALLCAGLLLALTRALPLAGVAGILVLVAHQLCKAIAGKPEGEAVQPAAPAKPNHVVENLAGLASAGMMIILAYNFGIEAFRVPTGSMEPTVYGDPLWGDRALVNKLAYRLGEPERGDICVFRFPMNRSQPFVKRLVGKPGEDVLIAQGDVYIKGEGDEYPMIWRKEGGVRDSMWLPYYAYEGGGELTLSTDFDRLSGRASVEGNAITLEASDGKPGTLRFPRGKSITDHNPTTAREFDSQYNRESVADLRVRCELSGSGKLDICLVRGGGTVTLKLSGAQSAVEILCVGDKNPMVIPLSGPALKAKVDLDAMASLIFGVADGAVDIELNGHAFDRIYFDTEVERYLRAQAVPLDFEHMAGIRRLMSALPDRSDCHIRFIVNEGSMTLRNLFIDRDIHYLGVMEFERGSRGLAAKAGVSRPYFHRVQGDSFFVLGDNTENSLDSRGWYTMTLALEGGEKYFFQLETLLAAARQQVMEEWQVRMLAALTQSPVGENVNDALEALGDAITRG